jgi:hypothetical protein
MMHYSPSVSTRGRILVLVPIIMQIVFVCWLAMVLSDAQAKLKAQWASELLIQKACELSRSTTDVIVFMQMPYDVKELVGRRTLRMLALSFSNYSKERRKNQKFCSGDSTNLLKSDSERRLLKTERRAFAQGWKRPENLYRQTLCRNTIMMTPPQG